MVHFHHNLRRFVTSVGFITTNLHSTSCFLSATKSRRPLNSVLAKLPSEKISTPHNLQSASPNSSRAFTFSSSQFSPLNMNNHKESNPNEDSPIKVSISDAFDGGNGRFLKSEVIDGQMTVYVNIKKDPFTQLEQTHHFQYFSFRSTISVPAGYDGASMKVKYVIANASKASYAIAWKGSTAFVSTTPSDPFSWKRQIDTKYDEATGELSWTYEHNPTSSAVHFAYFPPYSYERHLGLISKCTLAPKAHVQSLGQTLDGRELDCITVGTGDKQCWIIHRQHPGETMAEYYAEGLLERLLGLECGHSIDGMATDALKMYTFHIVPNMCPDGSFRGHLRTNAQGQNLNREWCSSGSDSTFYDAPTLERSPEVYHVLKKMDETGVDMFLDVHGDEELPFNFLAGGEGCPNWSNRLEALHGAFLAQYARSNSDMQIPKGYEPEEPKQGKMNICSNQIVSRFDCLGATLEMPFKDCMSNPDPERGWNPARAKLLGASVLEPLVFVGPFLRKEGSFWEDAFSSEDKYVRPTSKYESLS